MILSVKIQSRTQQLCFLLGRHSAGNEKSGGAEVGTRGGRGVQVKMALLLVAEVYYKGIGSR